MQVLSMTDADTKNEVRKQVLYALLRLFNTECEWNFFREEMFDDTISGHNAKKMHDWLQDVFKEHPWLREEFKEACSDDRR